MRRHTVEVDKTARLFQIGSLVFVLLAVLGILARDIAYRDPSATARAPSALEQKALTP